MKVSHRFVVVVALFVTCLITANIMAVRVISMPGPFSALPAAIIIFPLSYIIGDVLTEVYGYHQARRVIWLGFFCNLLAVGAFWVGGLLPSVIPEVQDAYRVIFGYAWRILLASFVAYLIGEFSNSFVLAKMKIRTSGRYLWARTIGSTVIGQGLDSAVFILIAFSGVLPWGDLGMMILTHWLFKTAYEAVATPFTYRIINYLKRKEGIDTYDKDINFNPLLITD
ncbi:queuosine precursor transporter [Chloroflexota bacterium]